MRTPVETCEFHLARCNVLTDSLIKNRQGFHIPPYSDLELYWNHLDNAKLPKETRS